MDSPGRGVWKRTPLLLLAPLIVLAIAASIYAFGLTRQRGPNADRGTEIPLKSPAIAKSPSTAIALSDKSLAPAGQVLSWKTQFGQFPPSTDSERELEKMLRGEDGEIDLGLANWLIAADVPQFADLSRESYFRQLDSIVEQVRQDMARMEKVAISRGKNPKDPDTRCSIFCNAIIKLGFDYAEEFRKQPLALPLKKALHGNPNNTFLAGLLRTHRGSCVSMPLIYLVIGHRFRFPVHLVALGDHYFIRWQELGYRLNIEPTRVDHVWVTDDDSAYIEELGLTGHQPQGSELRNLTRREVMGQLFFERSAYWIATAVPSGTQSWMDLSRARHLAPDDPAITKTHKGIFGHYGIKAEDTMATLREKEATLRKRT